MRILLKPVQWIYAVYALLVFIMLMIPVFIWALLVAPLGKVKGGNLTYKGCMVWADLWFALIFIWHRNVHFEPLRSDASYIFVANHISYLDAAIIPKTFRHPVRPLGKAEMGRVPVFGFIYKNAIVSVDRSNAANRAKSVQQLKSVLRKGISILVFPEGTFNETHRPLKDFYDGAFRVAIETGAPIKPVLLLDTYDRMHYRSIFSLSPGRSRSIFLPQISVEGLELKDVAYLKELVFEVMEKALITYKGSWIEKGKELTN